MCSKASSKDATVFTAIFPASVSYIQVHQDWDDGRQEYDVKFYAGTTEYSCDVDMNTGAVRDFDVDYADWD